jgi:MFS family permease
MVGKIGFGYLSEQITARYSMMICLGGQAIFLVLILGSENWLVMWTSVVFFGLCMGAFGALMQLIVQEGFGIKHFGSIMGSINLSSVVPLALGPIIAGISFDRTGSYQSAFVAVAIMFLLAIILLSYSGTPQYQSETHLD